MRNDNRSKHFDDDRKIARHSVQRKSADSSDTKQSVEDTQADAGQVDDHNEVSLASIQDVVRYVDRIAELATAVGEQQPAENLGKFGRFELLRELGSGGFARVYLANDPALNRHVALKIPHLRKLSNENTRLRFEREARAAALLSHPSIVPIFEAGTVDSVAYIASELCDGETLTNWIHRQGGPADSKFSAMLVATLADAMQYSHCRGIVHRDLKPSNIMLARLDAARPDADGDSEEQNSPFDSDLATHARSARILDFGLAKPIFEAEDMQLTRAGELVGTPAYMAPELAAGKTPTPQSDIYSLGVILYLLLTGHLPHSGKTTLELLKSIDQGTPTPPRKHNPSIHRDLEAITMKCLRKESTGRYEDALHLHDDLVNWLKTRPVSARPATFFEQAKMWYRREPKFATALLVAAVILIAGISGTAWQFRQAVLYRRDAEVAMLQAKRSQEAVAAAVSKHARTVVSVFDEYSSIDQWLRENPDGTGLREQVQMAADRVNESDGQNASLENWMGLTDAQLTMGSALAVMLLSRDYWKQQRYDEAIQLVTDATKRHRDNRVCVGIYGGTFSFLYGQHERDRQQLLTAGYSEQAIDARRESLRLASLDCLQRASEIGSLWLDQQNWGPIFDDPDFKVIVENSKFPVVFDKMSSRQMIGSMTKSFVTNGFKSLFSRNKDSATTRPKQVSDSQGQAESNTDTESSPDD